METIAVASVLLLIVVGAILVFFLMLVRRNRQHTQYVDSTENVAENNVKLLVAKVLKLETEYAQLQGALRAANQKLRVNEGERNDLETEVQKHEAERTRFQEELKHLKEGLRDAVEIRKNLEIQIENLKAECLKLQNDLRVVEKERDQAKDERRLAEEDRERYEEALQNAEQEIRRLKEVVKKFTKSERDKGEVPSALSQNTRDEDSTPSSDDSTEEDSKKRIPVYRGGRPRVSIKDTPKTNGKEIKPHRPKPEVICWKRERQWVLGVEVPEELLEKSELQVLQNGFPITQEESNESLWRLTQVSGRIVVRWNEEGTVENSQIDLGDGDYLLFKLSGQNQERGRLVSHPLSGWYLLVMREIWERDENVCGPPPVSPESVSISNYRAHYFIFEKDGYDRIAFCDPSGKPFLIESQISRFMLVGKQLPDANDDIGPLFGGEPPRIGAKEKTVWENIGTIVIGEEGSGKGKWRRAFAPVLGQIEQDLPTELAARRGGWYFLRFYDQRDSLIESLDFRFLTDLKDIKINACSVLPNLEGHSSAQLEFTHESNCFVSLAKRLEDSLKIEREHGKTTAIVPANPAWDLTDWEVEIASGSKINLEILIERIWWSFGLEGDKILTQGQWFDKPLCVSQENFRATSNESIFIWLPKPGWIDEILVGFEESKTKAFPIKTKERVVSIPLREFTDADELQNRTNRLSLKLWLRRKGRLEGGVTICEISHKGMAQVKISPQPIEDVALTQMPCCSTCDHARRRYRVIWCRRYQWKNVTEDIFQERFARLKCNEWRGEYFDKDGNSVTKL